jgi:uncharacterized protein YwqG
MNTEYFEQRPEELANISELRSKFDADEAERRRTDEEAKFKEKALEAQKRYYLDPSEIENPFTETSIEESRSTDLKLEINELVWRYASSKTTLEKAEDIASKFWSDIMATY